MIIVVSKFVTIVSTPLLCVNCELRQLTLLCHHHWRVWWWTLCGDRWHYCVNATVACGLWMEAVDTIVSTPVACVVMDSVWRQMTLLCQHHCRVWTVNWGSWHNCVITTDVFRGGLCVVTDDTIVSTSLTCVVVGRVTRTLVKAEGELRFFARVSSSCSTSGIVVYL